MDIEKKVFPLKDDAKFTVSYTEKYFDGKDTAIKIYDEYKISILMSDGLNAVKGDKFIKCEKYGVLFFHPDELHFGHFSSAGIHSYLDFYIPTDFFDKLNIKDSMLEFLNGSENDRINYIENEEISEIANEAIEALKKSECDCEMKLFSLMLRLVLLCGEQYEEQKEKSTHSKMPGIVTKTIRSILEKFNQKISLAELAEDANCSVAYLSRIFKQYTGTTIYSYITATRIAKAKNFLENNASVTDACFCSGYDDCSNFIRTFKKLTGKTPLQYKKQS